MVYRIIQRETHLKRRKISISSENHIKRIPVGMRNFGAVMFSVYQPEMHVELSKTSDSFFDPYSQQ